MDRSPGDLCSNVENKKSFTSRLSDRQNYALSLVLRKFIYENIQSIL